MSSVLSPPFGLALCLASSFLLSSAYAAKPAVKMVRDLNRTPGGFSRGIEWVQAFDGGVLFRADSFAEGPELWISRGTLKSTKVLKDIRPGALGSNPSAGITLGGLIYFGADDGVHGYELWRSDGTAEGTQLAVDLNPGAAASGANPLFGHEDLLLLSASLSGEGGSSDDLWSSDGTVSGTVDLNPVENGTRRFEDPRDFHVFDGTVHFRAGIKQIWKTDGTPEGTVKAYDPDLPEMHGIGEMVSSDNRLFFSTGAGNDASIWSVAAPGGTPQAVVSGPGDEYHLDEMVMLGDTLFYSYLSIGVDDGVHLTGATDGSPGTTRELLDGAMQDPVSWKGHLYFGSKPAGELAGLWRSDGMPQGTTLVKEFGQAVSNLKAAGDFLYFETADAQGNWSMWRTDGTAAGSRRVKGIPSGFSGGPSAALGNDLYYTEGHGVYENALFRTNGSRTGATRLTRIEKSTADAFYGNTGDPAMAAVGGLIYFTANDGLGPDKVWHSNGSAKGTREVWRSPSGQEVAPVIRGEFKGEVIFATYGSPELWMTTGKQDRARLLANFESGEVCTSLVTADGVCFFTVAGADGYRLWQTDGTPEGTKVVTTQDGGHVLAEWGNVVIVNGIAYCVVREEQASSTVWRSDGSTAGTWPLLEEAAGDDHELVGISYLTRIGGRLAFFVRSTYEGARLFTSDGTVPGTVELKNLGESGSTPLVSVDAAGLHLFYQGLTTEWYRSDGTEAGTYPVVDLTELGAKLNTGSGNPFYQVAGPSVYFSAERADTGYELWKAGPAAADCRLVRDINPGTGSSFPVEMAEADGILYFNSSDGVHGAELWRSDGTEAGTRMVGDIVPGALGSFPSSIHPAGKRLYFVAERQGFGRELHSLTLPALAR